MLTLIVSTVLTFVWRFLQVCQEFNTTWAWELEQKGYKEMQTECKAAILKVGVPQDDDVVSFSLAAVSFSLKPPDFVRFWHCWVIYSSPALFVLRECCPHKVIILKSHGASRLAFACGGISAPTSHCCSVFDWNEVKKTPYIHIQNLKKSTGSSTKTCSRVTEY